MRRFFNDYEKKQLFLQAGGRCRVCNALLEKGWHADHVIPFSLGGQTDIKNGQALCSKCNLSKSNKMKNQIHLRDWQERFVNQFSQRYNEYTKDNEQRKFFCCMAGVGSGKTIASIIASSLPQFAGWNYLIISPTIKVVKTWSDKFKEISDIDIDEKFNFKSFLNTFQGVSMSYQSLSDINLNVLLGHIVGPKTLVILDEVHHLGEQNAWAEAAIKIGERAGYILSLSGTPSRSDSKRIPFINYVESKDSLTYTCKPDFEYTYGDSVMDKTCCPILFNIIDAKSEYTADGFIDKQNEKHRIVLSNLLKKNDWILGAMNDANKALDDIRNNFMPNAGGLVVCQSIESAKMLHAMFPNDSVLITSEAQTSEDIDKFAESTTKWVISVQMISEGVDIPRLRVIVYWTDVTTKTFFSQVTGRGIRNRKDINGVIDHCHFFMPNYLPIVEHCIEIENEIRHIISAQEQEYTEKRERGEYSERLNLFDNQNVPVTVGDLNVMNAGYTMCPSVKNSIKDYDAVQQAHFVRMIAEQLNFMGIGEKKQPQPQKIQTKREMIDSVRKDTNDQIKKYVYSKFSDQEMRQFYIKETHNRLNKESGVYPKYKSSPLCDDLEILKRKLQLAKNLNNYHEKYN
ncbi:MAG: hypothetical protein EBR82_24975 [Caulobacteraceae bacterium]|nr:hypothetical protein [Caulobacteraceae bacterium]